MTSYEAQALSFIQTFSAEHGYPPSLQEISHALGWKAKSGAHRVVDNLERDGLIRRKARRARGIEVVPQRVDLSAIPMDDLLLEIGRRQLAAVQ